MVHWDSSPAESQIQESFASSMIYGTANDSSPQSFFKRLLETVCFLLNNFHSLFSFNFPLQFTFLRATFHQNIAQLKSLSLALLSARYAPVLWQLLNPWVMLFTTPLSHLLSSCFLLTGYYDCVRNMLRGTGAQPVPSIPEVRQLVALYGILPLGKSTPEGKTRWGFASCQKGAFYCL